MLVFNLCAVALLRQIAFSLISYAQPRGIFAKVSAKVGLVR